MNEDQKRAEALSDFLDAYVAGENTAPQTPEARLAADLADLAASLQLDALKPEPIPLSTLPLFARSGEKEDRPMIARHPQSAYSFSLPLVAVLLLCLFIGALLLPRTNRPSLAPPVQDQLYLPIPVGGVVSGIDPIAFDLMHNAGMEWTAFTVQYAPNNPQDAVQAARELIDGAHQRNFRVWITLRKAENTTFEGATFTLQEGFSQYAEVAAQIAALGADAIQIWEEPNLSVSWPDEQIDPAHYVELLRQSSEAINAANPATLVVSAAPAPTSAQAAFGSDVIWNDDIYYQTMASLGAAEYIDCVGVRYSEGVVEPAAIEGDPRDNYPTRYFVPMIQRAAAAFRESGLPLCLSEYGYLAGEGELLPDGFEATATTSVSEQAEWLAQGIQIATELSSVRIQMVIIYRMDATGKIPFDGYALVREDGSCPACDAIAALRQ